MAEVPSSAAWQGFPLRNPTEIVSNDSRLIFLTGTGANANTNQIGQIIAIERSIYTKTILKKEVLNELENAEKENPINIISTEKTQKTTMPLSQEDVKTLKQETKKGYILTVVFTIIFFLAVTILSLLTSLFSVAGLFSKVE